MEKNPQLMFFHWVICRWTVLPIEGEGREKDYFAMRSWVQDEIRDEPHPRGFGRMLARGALCKINEKITFFQPFEIETPRNMVQVLFHRSGG